MFNASEQGGELVIRFPPFWQMVKAGAAFTIGAALPGLLMVAAIFTVLVVFGAAAALGTAPTPRAAVPTVAPSVLHHR